MRAVVNNIHIKYHFIWKLHFQTIFLNVSLIKYTLKKKKYVKKKIACKSITQAWDDAEEVEGKQKQI